MQDLKLNPCLPGWMSDVKFYIDRTRHYIYLAKNDNDNEKVVRWGSLAAQALQHAEYCLGRVETALQQQEKIVKERKKLCGR